MTMLYEWMIYSLKVGACLAVFYLFFKLALSRETFHRFNRLLVLGAMAVSFLLPLCVITIERELPAGVERLLPVMSETSPEASPEASFLWRDLLGGLFLAGLVVTLLRSLVSLWRVLRLIHRGRHETLEDGTVLVSLPGTVPPFSWGRYVVISACDLAENGPAILAHEKAHVRHHHSLDLLVTDLAGCLQWFNPAMWLLRRELRAIHEYEADEAVLASGVDARNYQLLLIKKAVGGRWCSVANSFNHSKLKNRITMMLRTKSSRWIEARALLLLPLVGLAVGAFAQTRYVAPEDKDTKENREITLVGQKFSDLEPSELPLMLVDGQQVLSFDTLQVDRIASITVLKDSMAQASYGPQGKNGVILVTMKKPGETTTSGASAPTAGAAAESHAQAVVASRGVVTQTSIPTGSFQPENRAHTIVELNVEGDSVTLDPQLLERAGGYSTSDRVTFRKELGSNYVGISLLETGNPDSEEHAGTSATCNTVVGGKGGMIVTGPEVMSKSRSNDKGSVTVAKGHVVADFSEIDEADYRIEIDGKSATMSDLKRIEPGKIRQIEVSYDAGASDKPGLLRVRTRR